MPSAVTRSFLFRSIRRRSRLRLIRCAARSAPAATPWALQSMQYDGDIRSGESLPGLQRFFQTVAPSDLPNGQPMVHLRRRQRRLARSLYRVLRRSRVLHRGRDIGLQRLAGARREEAGATGFRLAFPTHSPRSLDEQSAMGLFYNGNNPLIFGSGYGPSDFDRTHVFNVDYHYRTSEISCALHVGRENRGRVGHPGCGHHPERPALQRDRLFRRRGKHLLRHLRRHHESHRAARIDARRHKR